MKRGSKKVTKVGALPAPWAIQGAADPDEGCDAAEGSNGEVWFKPTPPGDWWS